MKFSTNGLLLNEATLKKLKLAGLDLLYVSLRPFFDRTVSLLTQHYQEYEQMLSLLYIEHADKMKPLDPSWKVTRYEPHNWSGQIAIENPKRERAECLILRIGAVTVLWDGRVVNCCRDYEGAFVLGTVDDQVSSKPFTLCKSCDLDAGIQK
jgi:hypothetical protein